MCAGRLSHVLHRGCHGSRESLCCGPERQHRKHLYSNRQEEERSDLFGRAATKPKPTAAPEDGRPLLIAGLWEWEKGLSTNEGFWDDEDAGYLAFQAANLIAGSAGGSDVDLYGFTGNFTENIIIPLKAGYVPQGTRRRYSQGPLLGLTPMCVALEFLSTAYQGAEASIAVLITDGNPSEASGLSQDHVMKHTRELAYSLYEAGMRYLLIQVNTEGLERLYPADITVHVSCEEDLLQIPPTMSAMVG